LTARAGDLSASWFPILLFVAFPVVSWIFSSNMLENTMVVFILLASLLIIASIRQDRLPLAILFAVGGGFSIFLAILSKSVNGVYPLAIPFIWWLVIRDISFKRMVLITAVLLVAIGAASYFLVFRNPDAVSFFEGYFNKQLFKSMRGQRGSVARYTFLRKLVLESLVPWALCVLLYLWKRAELNLRRNRAFFLTVLIALSGSLPLFLSPRQTGWFLFPAFPFFAMAYAAFFSGSARRLEQDTARKSSLKGVILCLSVTILVTAVAWMFLEKGSVKREEDFYRDFVLQKVTIDERPVMTALPPSLEVKFALVAALQRELKASLTDDPNQKYLFARKEFQADSLITERYEKIHPENPSGYVLFRRKQCPDSAKRRVGETAKEQ
jgi:hypothetical protein